jgi:hypothetical protein
LLVVQITHRDIHFQGFPFGTVGLLFPLLFFAHVFMYHHIPITSSPSLLIVFPANQKPEGREQGTIPLPFYQTIRVLPRHG